MEKEKGLGSFFKKNWYSIVVLLYLISPVDFVPDDIPLVGSVDDASLLLIDLVRQYLSFKKKDVKED